MYFCYLHCPATFVRGLRVVLSSFRDQKRPGWLVLCTFLFQLRTSQLLLRPGLLAPSPGTIRSLSRRSLLLVFPFRAGASHECCDSQHPCSQSLFPASRFYLPTPHFCLVLHSDHFRASLNFQKLDQLSAVALLSLDGIATLAFPGRKRPSWLLDCIPL